MRDSAGFTLVETLVAAALLGFGLLAVAPLFVQSIEDNASGSDLGLVGAAAVARMEQLREQPFTASAVAPGGSLTSDVNGYFDNADPEIIVRWSILDNASLTGTRVVTVRAVARRAVQGRAKEFIVTTLRADEP